MQKERRRHHRVQIRTPVRGSVGPAAVWCIEGSVGGLGVVHDGSLPEPGRFCRLEIFSDWGPISADCQVVRTVESNGHDDTPPVFQSGLEILVMDRQSAQRLVTLIEAVSNDDF